MNKEPYIVGTIHFQIICHSDDSTIIEKINETKITDILLHPENGYYYYMDNLTTVHHSCICLSKKEALKRIVTKINELYDYE